MLRQRLPCRLQSAREVSSRAGKAVQPEAPAGRSEGIIPATEIIRDRHGNGGAIKARFSWEQLCALYLP